MMFEKIEKYGHEQVVFCHDRDLGLKAIIAIHNTALGPALGGLRMWEYNNEQEALDDVLRLSRGMTYKASISGLNLGGGKAVIIGNPRKDKSEALFRKFGRFVNNLGGKYITAEDVGVTTRDIEYIAMETNHVSGKPKENGGGGNPSPVTAYGVFLGMKAAARKKFGSDSLAGLKVLVQGAGSVGTHLVEHLVRERAKVAISDIYEESTKTLASKYKLEVVSPDEVYDFEMDIFSPCALGAVINDSTIEKLTCQLIAGSANNQLEEETKHGKMLMDKDILYAPDYVINAGGLINCYSEVLGYNKEAAMGQAEKIYDTTREIIEKSEKENIPTSLAANQMAEERIESMKKVKSSPSVYDSTTVI